MAKGTSTPACDRKQREGMEKSSQSGILFVLDKQVIWNNTEKGIPRRQTVLHKG